MSTLYVPNHVANEEKVKLSSVSDAYVAQEDKVLDPSLLEKGLKDRLPQPTGWRILVMPYAGKAMTEGGIHIPLAYQDANKFGQDADPWCQENQWVCIGRYAGARFRIDGGEVRIINDDEIIATIIEPDDVQHV